VFGVTIAAADAAKKQRAWLSAWGYYVATLMPVLGIVQVGNQAMADRYAYLPSIGPLFASAFVMVWIVGKVNAFYRSFKIKFIYTALAFCLFSSLSYITIKQTDIWKNGFVLWNHTILKGFESATAYNNRGLSLEGMGERNKARTDFERAIALDPRNYFSYNNMGVMYGKEGQYQRSTEYFLKAISINPKHADSYCNLGLSYFYMNQYENAVENYNKAIRLNQDFDMAYLNRGNLYVVMGNNELAVADYRKSCRLGNENACAILNMMVEQ
jgi:tetratricopeptide (TPR) repeat protein